MSKRLVQRPEERHITLFIENTHQELNLKDDVLTLSSSAKMGDYTETPINPSSSAS